MASAAGCLSTNPAGATIAVIAPTDLVLSRLRAPNSAEAGETIAIDIDTQNALATGDTQSDTLIVTLPAGIRGHYHLIASADDDGVITETDETNNTLSDKINVRTAH